MAKKVIFSTDQLPEGLSEHARRSLWLDLFAETVRPADISFLPGRPMGVHFEFTQTGTVAVGKYHGTVNSIKPAGSASSSPHDPVFHLSFNSGSSLLSCETAKNNCRMPTNVIVLFDSEMPYALRANGVNSWQGIQIPKQQLLERVAGAESLASAELPESPAARMFRRYVEMIGTDPEFADDPSLSDHVETTLIDLAVLVLGASREQMDLSRMRGLRAARAREIIAAIKADFANPALSPVTLGIRLGLSPRYINELLQESGTSFAERVLELRLQKARSLLMNSRTGSRRISDIALACGFNDISYFNRCFRKRFGDTPTQYRNTST